ncbi:hypothetical protein GCK72_016929 [Caenorhabditis remanei]|uniref:Uncharacterized protein n=1 Tax=Caenorhabditis remanei TaxID=31234 RepID=A0A6A5G5X2_CAERE|nr:hypothetical protein GCK72_016929 [Caenorhabditis remanei]KAF1750380.1 hypothetical protein GCK72_016929 [Caenorhabditis remanei]
MRVLILFNPRNHNQKKLNLAHLIFSTLIVFSIVSSTVLMMAKLRRRKLLSTSSRPFHRTKAETTLTVTMFIIMIPAFFAQILSAASLIGWQYYSYILIARPLLLDCRVNVVSCYFYLTHPIFKKNKNMIPPITSVRSMNTTTTC